MEKLAIIGGGAIGLLFSAHLVQKFDITVYTKTRDQADFIDWKGILFYKQQQKKRVHIQARPLQEGIKEADLVIVAVKHYHLSGLLNVLTEQVDEETPLLFLQNGMGHISLINQLRHKHLFIGVVEHGALKVGENEIHHTGVGVTKIACYKGNSSKIDELIKCENSGFPFLRTDDWYEAMTAKLVANACINPLTALYRVTNGKLLTNPSYFKNLQVVFQEISLALQLPNKPCYWEKLVEICEKTASNRSSMLRDIEENRKTEIETILGYVLDKAQSRGDVVPSLSFLYDSIKGMEKREED